mmetsp:Transcript_23604/g.34979  ORF Transcript_23604/g.34979 Transcript_23604/m.34979 type:complete len:238 (+) Transcript_23604:48-761(+)
MTCPYMCSSLETTSAPDAYWLLETRRRILDILRRITLHLTRKQGLTNTRMIFRDAFHQCLPFLCHHLSHFDNFFCCTNGIYKAASSPLWRQNGRSRLQQVINEIIRSTICQFTIKILFCSSRIIIPKENKRNLPLFKRSLPLPQNTMNGSLCTQIVHEIKVTPSKWGRLSHCTTRNIIHHIHGSSHKRPRFHRHTHIPPRLPSTTIRLKKRIQNLIIGIHQYIQILHPLIGNLFSHG